MNQLLITIVLVRVAFIISEMFQPSDEEILDWIDGGKLCQPDYSFPMCSCCGITRVRHDAAFGIDRCGKCGDPI